MYYNLFEIFAKVVEFESIDEAATILNQSKSSVEKAISKLEGDLGVKLFRNSSGKSSLTNSGIEFFQSISPVLNNIDEEHSTDYNASGQMSGNINLTAPDDIGLTLVTQLISEFHSKYPDVHFKTTITNQNMDLTKENMDIAFRAGKIDDSTLVQKRIFGVHNILVCSKKYIESYGCPNDPKEISNHSFYSFKGLEQNIFENDIEIKPIITTDSIPMLLSIALNNEGIVILPDFFCKKYLEEDTLVRIIPSWKSKADCIHILYSSTINLSQKVLTFIDTATSYFEKH